MNQHKSERQNDLLKWTWRSPQTFSLLPHELAFGLFLLITWARVVWVAGLLHPCALTLFGFWVGGIIGVVWAHQHPTPTRWRARLFIWGSMMGATYLLLGRVVPLIHPTHEDSLLRAMEFALVRDLPQLLMVNWQRPWLTDLCTLFYLFFFYYIFAGPLHYWWRDLPRAKACFGGLICMYSIGYLGYTCLPALGPVNQLGVSQGGWIAQTGMTFVMERCNKVDVFPSIHFAATFYLLLFDYKNYRARFWWLLLPCIGLWFSTVYLRFHYVVDLLAGMMLAFAAFWVATAIQQSLATAAHDRQGPLPDEE